MADRGGDNKGQTTWRLALTVPAGAAEAFEGLISAYLPAVSVFGEDDAPYREVEGFGPGEPDCNAIAVSIAVLSRSLGVAEPDLTVEEIPPTDWLAATYEAFPPVRIGRFHVHGSHDRSSVPIGAIGLCIDAATAFGTGEHETTAGCLTALQQLARRRRFRNVLDMGCGSGVLAFAAARLWRAPVLAVDVDPEAVRVARINARANRVGEWVTTLAAEGYADRRVRRSGPYDLIIANILARPLMAMAPDLAANLAPGGVAVLAGLLNGQQAQVLAAHRLQGLSLAARLPMGEWPTLVIRKKTGAAALPPWVGGAVR